MDIYPESCTVNFVQTKAKVAQVSNAFNTLLQGP